MSISKNKITLILQCLLALGLILALIWAFKSSRVESKGFDVKREPVVYSRKIIPVETHTLASKANIQGLFAIQTRRQGNDPELKYKTLIECLIREESSGNPDAYNRYDPVTPSYSILQFKRTTFEHYCVEKYGYRNDIWNPEIQKQCADSMLRKDFGNVTHWSTAQRCLH